MKRNVGRHPVSIWLTHDPKSQFLTGNAFPGVLLQLGRISPNEDENTVSFVGNFPLSHSFRSPCFLGGENTDTAHRTLRAPRVYTFAERKEERLRVFALRHFFLCDDDTLL
jgi:hypothetical protein